MKYSVSIFFLMTILVLPLTSSAMYTELGFSYGRKKTSFDAANNFDSESMTGSVSLYFAEQIALELSYTDAASTQNQRASVADTPRTVYQKTQIIGGDLIYVFADRKAFLQPFVKGGVARISRRQEIRDGSFNTSPLDPDEAIAPSYGLGVKVALTENFGLKASYSIWQTPIGGGSKTNDDAITAGVTWMF
jgi:hypothetical protein